MVARTWVDVGVRDGPHVHGPAGVGEQDVEPVPFGRGRRPPPRRPVPRRSRRPRRRPRGARAAARPVVRRRGAAARSSRLATASAAAPRCARRWSRGRRPGPGGRPLRGRSRCPRRSPGPTRPATPDAVSAHCHGAAPAGRALRCPPSWLPSATMSAVSARPHVTATGDRRRPLQRSAAMRDRQFNLADLFELVVDTVPDRDWPWWPARPAHLRRARRPGQPVRPPPDGARARAPAPTSASSPTTGPNGSRP